MSAADDDINPPECAEDIDEVTRSKWDNFEDALEYLPDDAEFVSDDGCGEDEDPEEIRRHHEADDEGKFHDDPLWWGKSAFEIKACTDDAKEQGNAAYKEGDQQLANRHWKNALKGAQKLKDAETEFRLRLNLAMGYTKLGKTSKALDHCTVALCDPLRSSVPAPLQAKAHYRKAEAFESLGEIEKALGSLKAALQVEPGNKEARGKYAELKKVEQEQHAREKSMFAGKSLLQAISTGKDYTAQPAKECDSDSDEESDGDIGNEETCIEEVQQKAHQRHLEEDEQVGVDGCIATKASTAEEEHIAADGYSALKAPAAAATDFDVDSITDRKGANELAEQIMNCRGINYVGPVMDLFGNVK